MQYDGEWMTGDWLYFLGKVAGHVVDKQTATDAPIAIMEEATPYAYSRTIISSVSLKCFSVLRNEDIRWF